MDEIVGNTVIWLDSVKSTNDYASTLLPEPNIKTGTVVVAKHQLSGRGQRENVWYSESNKNLSFTIIIKDVSLEIEPQFYLNMAVALGIAEFLIKTLSPINMVEIKWPNDILVNRKKIAGVLIENSIVGNSITSSIIGIGLNINQHQFSIEDIYRKPTSMSLCENSEFEIETCLKEICICIDNQLKNFFNKKYTEVSTQYHTLLYQYKIKSPFIYQNKKIEATIEGVNENGQLILTSVSNENITCNIHEIKFLI